MRITVATVAMSLTIKALRLKRRINERSAGEKGEQAVLGVSFFASRITW